MVEEEKKIEKTKPIREARVVEVPTQMGLVIELEDGTQVEELGLLIRIYNKLLKIEKSVA